jgi:excisionase family DNA binding protein
LLSVQEVAAELKASDAYVRRLLISQRLYGVKVGHVWAVYRQDLDDFKRLRRPPGRPRKVPAPSLDEVEVRRRITEERASVKTGLLLRNPRSVRRRS